MSAERLTDVEYEVVPTYDDVQQLIALMNGSDGYGAPVRMTDYRGASYGQYVQSDEQIAQFLGDAGGVVFDIKESGIDGTAPASFSDTLDVTGDTTMGANATVGGTFGVTGATTLAGLTAGASTLASLGVTNNATVGGTFGVTGATTLAGLTATTVHGTGAVDFDSTLNADGNVTMGGTLDVDGASTLAALTATTIHGTGAATFDSTAAITGNVTVGGTLGVTGALTGGTFGFNGATPAVPATWTPNGGFTTDRVVSGLNQSGAIGAPAVIGDAARRDHTDAVRQDVRQLYDLFDTLLADLRLSGVLK